MAADNGASRAGRARFPKRWRASGRNGTFASVQADRWRLVLDDLATTDVSLANPESNRVGTVR